MVKKFDSAIDKILDPQSSKPTSTQTHKPTDAYLHKPTNTHIHKTVIPQKEPTERLDAMIPQNLKWKLEDHVKNTNRTRKRGDKTSMTAEIITAIESHLKNTKY